MEILFVCRSILYLCTISSPFQFHCLLDSPGGGFTHFKKRRAAQYFLTEDEDNNNCLDDIPTSSSPEPLSPTILLGNLPQTNNLQGLLRRQKLNSQGSSSIASFSNSSSYNTEVDSAQSSPVSLVASPKGLVPWAPYSLFFNSFATAAANSIDERSGKDLNISKSGKRKIQEEDLPINYSTKKATSLHLRKDRRNKKEEEELVYGSENICDEEEDDNMHSLRMRLNYYGNNGLSCDVDDQTEDYDPGKNQDLMYFLIHPGH